MLKTLKQKSKRLILLKINLRNFIKYQLLTYVVILSSIALCAWLFNRWVEAFMFVVAHICIRNSFDKQFHFNKTAYCLSLTLAIIWFAIPVTLPITASLLSSIPIAYLICFFGFLAQDRLDVILKNNDLDKEISDLLFQLRNYKNTDIYNMTEEELRQYGAKNQLSEVQIDILCCRIFQHLKISEICKYYNYGRTTIKYHLGQIKHKLGITTL